MSYDTLLFGHALFESIPFTTMAALVFAAAGALVASFADTYSWRLAMGEDIHGRSRCDSCGHTLARLETVPILSFLVLRGSCRYCGASISSRHLIIELVGIGIFESVLFRYGITPELIEYVLFSSLLLVMCLTSLDAYLVPNWTILSAMGVRIGFLLVMMLTGISEFAGPSELVDSLLGMVAVGAVLLIASAIAGAVAGHRVIGGGSVKMLMVAALYFGWQMTVILGFLACLIAVFVSVLSPSWQMGAYDEDRGSFYDDYADQLSGEMLQYFAYDDEDPIADEQTDLSYLKGMADSEASGEDDLDDGEGSYLHDPESMEAKQDVSGTGEAQDPDKTIFVMPRDPGQTMRFTPEELARREAELRECLSDDAKVKTSVMNPLALDDAQHLDAAPDEGGSADQAAADGSLPVDADHNEAEDAISPVSAQSEEDVQQDGKDGADAEAASNDSQNDAAKTKMDEADKPHPLRRQSAKKRLVLFNEDDLARPLHIIPVGPAIAIATWCVMLVGVSVINFTASLF